MPRSALAFVIAEAIKLGLTPLLREAGFRKQGTSFYLLAEQSNKLVLVQSSQWNTSSRSRFTMELGIYFPELDAVMDQVWTKPEAEQWTPKIYNCQLRRRIGFLFSVPRDFWWEVTPASNARDLAGELADTWQHYGAPWMLRNSNLREAAADLEAQMMYWPAAAGRLALGERDEASRLAKEFVKSFTREEPHPANAAIVRKYLKNIRDWCSRHELEI